MSKTELCCRNVYFNWDALRPEVQERIARGIRRINAEFSGATAKAANSASVKVRQERAIKNLKNAM